VLGYQSNRYKLAIAGRAGGTKGLLFQFASLSDLH
jgi:hypothetical protein